MEVSNKVILLTGGLGGIGQALAHEFLSHGAKGVALVDFNVSQEHTFLKELESKHGPNKAIVIKADVRKQDAVIRAFETTVSKFGNLDIVVNGAGIILLEDWEKELSVNYKGAYIVLQLALKKYLPKHKSGSEAVIINIASVAGLEPVPVQINYGATKAALIALSRSYSFSHFYEKYNVKILTICPGYTETPMCDQAKKNPMMATICETLKKQTPEELSVLIRKVLKIFANGDVYRIQGKKIHKMIFENKYELIEVIE